MDVEALLRRIGLDQRPAPTIDGLRRVHRAYVGSVPYEALSVQLGEFAPLDVDALAERLLSGGRGGYCFEVNGVLGDPIEAPVAVANGAGAVPTARKPRRERAASSGAGGADELESPLQGNMWKVLVKKGDTVEEGQLLCIIEAMKMENEITAHKAGKISELAVKEGEPVSSGATIAVITDAPSDGDGGGDSEE